ncbi:MAG: hypothetical protein WBA51_14735 [Erythrobacter sp.]
MIPQPFHRPVCAAPARSHRRKSGSPAAQIPIINQIHALTKFCRRVEPTGQIIVHFHHRQRRDGQSAGQTCDKERGGGMAPRHSAVRIERRGRSSNTVEKTDCSTSRNESPVERNVQAVGERSTHWLKRLRGRLLLALVLGVGASLTGPYGTYLTFDPILRSIYWIAILIGGFGIWWILEIVVQKLAGKQTFAIEYALIIPPFAAINSGFVLGLNRGLGSMFGFTIPVDWTELLVSHMLLSFLVILPTSIPNR